MLIYMITHNDLSVSEGPVTHFTEIAQNFNALGHKATAFAPDLSVGRRPWPLEVHYLPSLVRRRGISQLFYELSLLVALWKACRRRPPDLIYSRQSYISLAAPFVAARLGIPLVTEVNGVFTDDLAGRNAGVLRRWINRVSEGYAYARSQLIIGVSQRVCDVAAELYGVPEEKLLALENGVNTEKFQPQPEAVRTDLRGRLGLAPEHVCIGYVGCFTPFDGVEQLPSVARRLADDGVENFRFVLIGEEKKKGEVERLIDLEGVSEYFTLTGRIEYAELQEHLSVFDIGIAPYRLRQHDDMGNATYIGNSSLKCLEYSAMGLPVVSTYLPQSAYIEASNCGILCPPEDEDMLVEAIKTLIGQGEAAWGNMGERGRELVVEQRSWRSVANRTIEAIEAVIG
ncbi:MAG: glycosyltransferase family 4 protein [Lentisphaeria bacterium]|jgi:glycosyltransferase involved in cell wall biosynthesis|nr:glycosyltransferase family 4 protein [Lentisphaeria bacterium]MDP7741816.1 glycosyltransferase family 4 protein [Lentisphaeria bacterium]